jgi:hypothetical protein
VYPMRWAKYEDLIRQTCLAPAWTVVAVEEDGDPTRITYDRDATRWTCATCTCDDSATVISSKPLSIQRFCEWTTSEIDSEVNNIRKATDFCTLQGTR